MSQFNHLQRQVGRARVPVDSSGRAGRELIKGVGYASANNTQAYWSAY
jgi:hypothetical protein